MRRFKAFVTALILFAMTVLIVHIVTREHAADDPAGYALWDSEEKSLSYTGLTANMTDNMIPVFASSELQHGTETIFHPCRLFADTDFTPMLIGAGYYQSLGHSVTLSAIEDAMPVRKAVLILSPQWFRKSGVVDQAYTSRFSQLLYQHMLTNEKLSGKTKEYISERTAELLSPDPQTRDRVKLDEAVLLMDQAGPVDRFSQAVWERFLTWRDEESIVLRQKTVRVRPLQGLYTEKPVSEEEGHLPDSFWKSMLELAEVDGAANNTNEFFIKDDAYARLEPYLPLKKGMNADALKGYQTGPEFSDLRCFLDVCSETGVEPMLVILPVNGYYYDFTAFPQSARQAYYEKIRKIAQEYDAAVADFSGDEYTKYFFEDRVHLGQKGWVMVSEEIYRFYQGETPAA